MYDKHTYCTDYYKYRAMVEKIVNGEKVKYPVSWLKRKIEESYDNDRLQGGQYDYLMGMLQDLDDNDEKKEKKSNKK